MCGNDKETIRLCLNSHPEAYRRLVKRYQASLRAYLLGWLGNPEQAEDAAQEAFVRAFFSLDKLKKPESFFSWLLGIATRVAKEQQRAERRHREIVRLAREEGPSPSVASDRGLQQAVARLPDSYRELILLRYYAGMSCGQVAEQFAIPLGTVTKKLSRAYALLRESLRPCEDPSECREVNR